MHRPKRSSRALVLIALAAIVALVGAACGSDDDGGSAVSVDGAWARTSPAMADTGVVYMDLTADETTALVAASVSEDVAAAVEIHETVMADGEMADGEMADGEMADGEMADGEMSDGEMADGEMSDGEMADEEMSDGEMADGEMADGEMSGEEKSDGEMSDGEMSGHEMSGAMSMQEVERIELPAGETVVLEPGGLHIMLVELAAPLEEGDDIELTLTFEDGSEAVETVPVRSEAP